MNLREVKNKLIERAVERLSKQGGFAVDQTMAPVNGCKYRVTVGEEARCCVAGSLIDDDKYLEQMEGRFADHSLVLNAIMLSNPWIPQDLREPVGMFLSSLQARHDGVAKTVDFKEYLAELRAMSERV